ncbi:MAG TPA: DapH/DapD/GlmU-related protein [Phycisphaerae bacterium]|nr:DapH/DapD/GlmU-related protein [Phycisphaerae bacterium]
MKVKITDAGRPQTMQPLSCTRNVSEMRVANKSIIELQTAALTAADFEFGDAADGELLLNVCGSAYLGADTLKKLAAAKKPMRIVDSAQNLLAWLSAGDSMCDDAESITAADGDIFLKYPWDLLKLNEMLLADLHAQPINLPGVLVMGNLVYGEGSRILPGVVIEGNVIIGKNCNIGPNCYIRGYTAIGDNCHVGNAVEVKNSILYDRVSVGHLSYCGDTIAGEKTNFGAGTITSNFRHDGRNHRSMVGEKLVDTGRRKFGSIIGDGVHTGIHTSIYPGRKIWAGCSTLPGAIVKYDVTA